MTTAAKSGRHPSAAIAWAAKDGIYVEFPTKSGPPYITRFPKTANGLASALNILIENPAPAPTLPPADHPSIRRFGTNASAEVRTQAADIVRKMLLKGRV